MNKMTTADSKPVARMKTAYPHPVSQAVADDECFGSSRINTKHPLHVSPTDGHTVSGSRSLISRPGLEGRLS